MTVISVDRLSKAYRLGQIGTGTLSHDLNVWWAKARGKPNPLLKIGQHDQGKGDCETIWALKEVRFEVRQGEVLGIIGRNGAGKSTLLKILSQITAPTSGHIRVKGRIASLLEVGTGFHPELTGRENTYLNGAILGMKKAEIDRKLDEIVAFSEVEQFLDTPVKRYSSGMYVRLAFAVAAHLDPEILLVDEVLAVGDAAFQKKCLGKMGDVAKGGRTVLFVSHNMSAILFLCSRALLLDGGRVSQEGPTKDVADSYMRSAIMLAATPVSERADRYGTGTARLTFFSFESVDGGSVIRSDDRLRIRLGYTSPSALSHPAFLVRISDLTGVSVFYLDSRDTGWEPDVLPESGIVTCVTGPINLMPHSYTVNVALCTGAAGDIADNVKLAHMFQVEAVDFHQAGKLPRRDAAICMVRQEWGFAESDTILHGVDAEQALDSRRIPFTEESRA